MAQRGAALLAVLGLMLILLPLGAYVVLQCRTDLLIQRGFRDEIEAFYVAEAGLEHAVAEIRPDQSFAEVLAGPDGLAGTADDGVFPFLEGAPAAFPAAPFRYDVRVSPAAGNSLSVTSQGKGKNGATKVVSALVSRSPAAWTPAALLAQDGLAGIDLGDGSMLLSGFDHRLGDAPSRPTGTAAAVAAAASTSASTESELRERLGAALAGQLVGAGGSPSVVTAPPVDIQAFVSRLASLPNAVLLGGVGPSDQVDFGTRQAPQASVVAGELDIREHASGTGILVILGGLHVSGTFDFAGVLVVMGGISLEPASDVRIAGALWRGASVDERLQLRGTGAVMYSSEALAEVDAAFPGALPHAVIMAGWLEQL